MAATATKYSIVMTMRDNVDDKETDPDKLSHYIKTCGEWKITKDFEVLSPSRSAVTTGYIAQLVQKQTTVVKKHGAGEKVYTTNEEISEMTGNHTKYMTFDYIEVFTWQTDQWEADQFTNGAVVPFDGDDALCVDDTDESERDYRTKGVTKMVGTVIYIPARAGFSPTAFGFKKPRSLTDDNPANGLFWKPFDKAIWERMYSMRASDPYYHRVEVKWDYPTGGCASETKLTQSCDGGVNFRASMKSEPDCPGRVATTRGRARTRVRGRGRGGGRRSSRYRRRRSRSIF